MAPIHQTYPRLAEVVGTRFEGQVAGLEEPYREDRQTLIEERRRHSRGFWNTVAIAAFETDRDRLESAIWRLRAIEHGLEQAARCAKHRKFRDSLTRDDAGFQQVLAELHVLRRIGPELDQLDIELPGSKADKNYDLHGVLAGPDEEKVEIHADCKWRTATALGEVSPGTVLDIDSLLGSTFDASCFAILARNRLTDADAITAATMLDECRKYLRSTSPQQTSVTVATADQHLKGRALSFGLHAAMLGETVYAVDIDGFAAAFIPSEQLFFFESDILERVEFHALPPVGDRGYCYVIPKPESQAVFSKDVRAEWEPGVSYSDNDVEVPESARLRDLISSVHLQLPTTPYNIVLVGVEHSADFDDLELAVRGEPVPNGASISFCGGLFDADEYKAISAVVGFTLYPPGIPYTGVPHQEARCWANPSATASLPDWALERLRTLLEGSSAD